MAEPESPRTYRANGPHHFRWDQTGVFLDGKPLYATELNVQGKVQELTRVTVVLDLYPHDVVVDLPADFTVEARPLTVDIDDGGSGGFDAVPA